MPEETLTLLFSHIDPLYELHAAFLKDIEQRMATWYVESLSWRPSMLYIVTAGRDEAMLISTATTGR